MHGSCAEATTHEFFVSTHFIERYSGAFDWPAVVSPIDVNLNCPTTVRSSNQAQAIIIVKVSYRSARLTRAILKSLDLRATTMTTLWFET